MKKKTALLLSLILLLTVILCPMAYGHSGRTDANGGHHDYKNMSGLGPYHYHCGGHPAHLHPNGICPYSTTATTTSTKTTTTTAATPKATVTAFPITINGNKVDNTALKYPFILYKDITYIPLTYRNLQSIGCTMAFTDNTFSIYTGQKVNYMTDTAGKASLGATKTITTNLSYSTYINDTYYIEETLYPMFNCNDVTYIPLTTSTAKLLNLTLTWDATNGIGITTNK